MQVRSVDADPSISIWRLRLGVSFVPGLMVPGRESKVRIPRLNRLLKSSILFSILGGATVYRCDNLPVLSAGFSR